MLETRPDRSKTYGWIFVVVFFFVECRAPSVSRDRPLWRFIHRLIRPATTPFFAAIVYRRKSWCPIFRVRGRGWWRETFPFKRRQKKMVVFLPRSHWPPWGGIGRYVLHHVPFLFWFTNGNSTRKKNEVPNDESVQMSWRRRRPRRRRRRVCFHSRPSTRATSFNRRVAMATLTFFQRKRNHNITNCHCLGPFVRTVAGFVFVICCCCCCLN